MLGIMREMRKASLDAHVTGDGGNGGMALLIWVDAAIYQALG